MDLPPFMPNDEQLQKLADLFTPAPGMFVDNLETGDAVTVDEMRRVIEEGWNPSDPAQLVAGFVTGLGVEWMEGHPDPQPDYEWASGASGAYYRVPRAIADHVGELRAKIQDLERQRVATLIKHRAELAEAMGTPRPDPEPIPPGADAPTL